MSSKLSDRKIKSALELTIDWFYERIPDGRLVLSQNELFETSLLKKLSKRKYDLNTVRAMFRSVYWELYKDGTLKVETGAGISYELKRVNQERKKEFSKFVFNKHARYIRANYGK